MLRSMLYLFLALLPISAAPQNLPDFEKVIQNSLPAVVTVKTYKSLDDNLAANSGIKIPENVKHLFQSQEKSAVRENIGAGFFINQDGYILTCFHIVKNAESIVVATYDEQAFSARLMGADAVSDLAVLKIEGRKFPVLGFEKSKTVTVGSWVFAVGAPFGFEFSANVGIVSALNRTITLNRDSEIIPYVQTSIAINPGHSGGPLMNLSGEVVGVNSYMFTDQANSVGLSFAVPASVAQFVSAQLLTSESVKRGVLGVMLKDESSDDFKKTKNETGALVASLVKNGAAEKYGILSGDIILEFDNHRVTKPITVKQLEGLTVPNQKVNLLIYRRDKIQTIEVVMGVAIQNE